MTHRLHGRQTDRGSNPNNVKAKEIENKKEEKKNATKSNEEKTNCNLFLEQSTDNNSNKSSI